MVLQQTLGRRSPAKQDPVMRQMAAMLPSASCSLPELALPTTTAALQVGNQHSLNRLQCLSSQDPPL